MNWDPVNQKVNLGGSGAAMELVDLHNYWDEDLAEASEKAAITMDTAKAGNYYYYFSDTYGIAYMSVGGIETSLQEIVFKFNTDTDSSFMPRISFPSSLQWINEPSFEAGKTYLVSIVNNIAVAAEVTA